MLKRLFIALLLCGIALNSPAEELVKNGEGERSQLSKMDRFLQVNLVGIGVITAWGVANWDYFSRRPHTFAEGWFQNDTSHGGADKLGHLYSTYLTSHALSHLYERWGFSRNDAALYGALSSFTIHGYMEFGDSFSDFGFSHEDFIANTLGGLAGYYLYRYPDLAEKIDLRWEYGFSPTEADFVTDYENSKYLVALKLHGFESTRETFLKYLELHAGYYSRGFSPTEPDRERNVYAGIGVNLSDIFRNHSFKKTATVFNYLQVPYTYIPFKNDLND